MDDSTIKVTGKKTNPWPGRIGRLFIALPYVIGVIVWSIIGVYSVAELQAAAEGFESPCAALSDKTVSYAELNDLYDQYLSRDDSSGPLMQNYRGNDDGTYDIWFQGDSEQCYPWSSFDADATAWILGTMMGVGAYAVIIGIALLIADGWAPVIMLAKWWWHGSPDDHNCHDPECACGFHGESTFDLQQREWFVTCRDRDCVCPEAKHNEDTFNDVTGEWE